MSKVDATEQIGPDSDDLEHVRDIEDGALFSLPEWEQIHRDLGDDPSRAALVAWRVAHPSAMVDRLRSKLRSPPDLPRSSPPRSQARAKPPHGARLASPRTVSHSTVVEPGGRG